MAGVEQGRGGEDAQQEQSGSRLQADHSMPHGSQPNLIFQLDRDGLVVHVWATDPGLLPKPEADVIGRTITDALGVEVGALHDEAVRLALTTGVGTERDYELDSPTGRRYMSATSVIFPSLDQHEQRGVMYWIRDVTQEVRARRRQSRTQRLATISRLAAGVAHEINNPLAYISLNLEGVERRVTQLHARPNTGTPDDFEDIALSLSMIREGTNRVQMVVRELLNFARPNDAPTSVDLTHVLRVALELVGGEGHEHVMVNRDLGATPMVLADEARLIQVFTNLLQNAVQAIEKRAANSGLPSGEVNVSARTDERGWAVVEVRDNGCGIEKKQLSKIFEPFYTTKPQRVGLGLALCQMWVLSYSGHIDVSSIPGQGSTFSVSLPPQ
jgi:two-component system, NtrC family, sensor kinase